MLEFYQPAQSGAFDEMALVEVSSRDEAIEPRLGSGGRGQPEEAHAIPLWGLRTNEASAGCAVVVPPLRSGVESGWRVTADATLRSWEVDAIERRELRAQAGASGFLRQASVAHVQRMKAAVARMEKPVEGLEEWLGERPELLGLVKGAIPRLHALFGLDVRLRVDRVFFGDGSGPAEGEVYLRIATKLDVDAADAAYQEFLERYWIEQSSDHLDAPGLAIVFE